MTGTPVALLDAVVRDALDPSYAEAAQRRRGAGPAPGRRSAGGPRRTSLAGAMLLIGAGVVTGLAVSFQHKALPAVGAARSALAGDAGERTQQVRDLEGAVAARQRQLAARQDQQLQATSTGRLLQRQTAALAAAAGQTPVSGPGVTVTVSDVLAASSPDAAGRPHGALAARTGTVTDRDLQNVVNALWAGGGEAVAVGGVRLGPQTAIRTAGETILVDFKALRSPYVLTALGGPGLYDAIAGAPALEALRAGPAGTHPDLVIRTAGSLQLPAASSAQPGSAHPLRTGGRS